MTGHKHGTRANGVATQGDAVSGKIIQEPGHIAYAPVFSLDDTGASLVGLLRGISSRPPLGLEGHGHFMPDTYSLLSSQKHLQAPIRLSLQLLAAAAELPHTSTFIDTEDVPPTLRTQLQAHIPSSEIEIMREFNKAASHPSGSLWLNIDTPHFRIESAFDRPEDVGSPQKPGHSNDKKNLRLSQSHPPPDLALARAPEVEQVRQSEQPD